MMRYALPLLLGTAIACVSSASVAAPMAKVPTPTLAQSRPSSADKRSDTTGYVGEDAMIPMRDGVQLHVQIWRPAGMARPLPILMTRSPYGFTSARIKGFLAKGGICAELASDKYIFVFEDIRGRFGSQGNYQTMRPRAALPGGIDESTDTYDTIDWLVRSLPHNNGRVGVFGVSYGGWTSAMATINPHWALKAVSSQASPDDMWLGDDFHHNGAFRLDYAWSWVSALETDGRTMKHFDFGGKDPYDWYLQQHDLATLDQQKMGHPMADWQAFVQHPDYDGYWRASRTTNNLPARPTVPDLIVAGWWDQEDFFGPMTIYARQQAGDVDHHNHLVVGPWNHGGWRAEGARYGPFDLGSATGRWFRSRVELPWFRYWLKGEGQLNVPPVLVFQSGRNRWKALDHWPQQAGVASRQLYFHSNGRLSFDPPAPSEAAEDHFISDPSRPVPYRDPKIMTPVIADGSTWSDWIADDQAPFAKRDDVLSWQTAPLDRDVVVSGNLAANLFASTSGRDADWIVKLIDVYPDNRDTPVGLRGRERLIASDVFRGRYVESFERSAPLTPGRVTAYTIDLHSASHVFQKGHRIAVQVQSSWFPLIDRNPQTWVPNIMKAKPQDYRSEVHKVYHSVEFPSSVTMSVASP